MRRNPRFQLETALNGSLYKALSNDPNAPEWLRKCFLYRQREAYVDC